MPDSGEPAEAGERPIRSFVAVPVPPEVRAALAAAVEEFRAHGDVRWTPPEQYHLTLRFLGDALPRQLAEVAKGLEGIANTCVQFPIRFDRIGAFPSVPRPQVLWVGLAEGGEELGSLAENVMRITSAAGFEAERRPFRPHLTVGRVRSRQGQQELASRLSRRGFPGLPGFTASEIVLMESELLASGSVHRVRALFSLRKSPNTATAGGE